MAKKDERTELEKNLKDEPDQAEKNRQCAELLLAGKKAHEEAKKK